MKKWLIVIVLLLIVLGVTAFFLIQKEEKFPYTVLSGKPSLSGEIVKNPDFNYSGYGFLSPEHAIEGIPILERTKIDWNSDGCYRNITVYGRSGFIVIHPLNLTQGRYIEQEVYLPPGKEYVLNVGLANVAGELPWAGSIGCDDVGFKILIKDLTTNTEKVIFNTIINAEDGWKDFSIFLGSKYSGKKIVLRIESYSGGPCGKWGGEWGAVDYLDITSK